MASRNKVFSKVLQLIDKKVDGDIVMLLSNLETNAIRNACEYISVNKPFNHEKLLASTELEISGNFIEEPSYDAIYTFFNLMDTKYILQPKLHLVEFFGNTVDSIGQKIENVNSFYSIPIKNSHNIGYYIIKEDKIYIFISEDYPREAYIKITHYHYPSMTEFPTELENILISEFLRLISSELDKSNEQKK